MTNIVYRIDWEESERGWGCRPDGYSLHKDELTAKVYIQVYWSTMPDEVPDEYSRPGGERWIEVDMEIYKRVQEEGSIRIY